MSSNERKKQWQNTGKGHNETLEIAMPLEQTRVATNAVRRHTPENRPRGDSRATRDSRFCERACGEVCRCNKVNTKSNILTIFPLLSLWRLGSCVMIVHSHCRQSRNLCRCSSSSCAYCSLKHYR
jgi:hypothetical protein